MSEHTTMKRVLKKTLPKAKKLAKRMTKEEERKVTEMEAIDKAVTEKLEN